jgi:hypothetical protein
MGASSAVVGAMKQREGRLQELRASLAVMQGVPNPRPECRLDPLGGASAAFGVERPGSPERPLSLASVFARVLESRLVFVPRHEGDEHWYEFSGEGSLTKFFRSVEPLSNAMASQALPSWNQIARFLETMRLLRDSVGFAA